MMVPTNGQRDTVEGLSPGQTCSAASFEQQVSMFRANEVLINETSSEKARSSPKLTSHSVSTGNAKTQICFDFTKNQCSRGASCKFSHDLDLIIQVNSQEKGICFDFLKGTCARGPLCRFSHDIRNLHNIPFQSTNGSTWSSQRRTTKSICYDFVKNQCSRGDVCKYSHDIASILYANHQPSRGGKNVMNVMCLDFSRGRCMRGDACKFAHTADPTLTALPPPKRISHSGEPQDANQYQGQSTEHYVALLRLLESVRLEQVSASQGSSSSSFHEAHEFAPPSAAPFNDFQEPGLVPQNFGLPRCDRPPDGLTVPFYHSGQSSSAFKSAKVSPHLLYGNSYHQLDSPTIPASWGEQSQGDVRSHGSVMPQGTLYPPDLLPPASGQPLTLTGGRGGDQMMRLEALKSIWSQK